MKKLILIVSAFACFFLLSNEAFSQAPGNGGNNNGNIIRFEAIAIVTQGGVFAVVPGGNAGGAIALTNGPGLVQSGHLLNGDKVEVQVMREGGHTVGTGNVIEIIK